MDDTEDDNAAAVLALDVRYDLALSKTVRRPERLRVGDTVDYLLRLRNQGTVPSGQVEFQDVLPAGLAFVSASHGGTADGSTVSWTVDRLAAGAERTVRVTVRLTDATRSSYRNVAAVRTTPGTRC